MIRPVDVISAGLMRSPMLQRLGFCRHGQARQASLTPRVLGNRAWNEGRNA